MKEFGLALAGCIVLGLTTAALGQDKVSQEKLIGTWQIKEGIVVEFTKDGKMKLTAKVEDRTVSFDGTYVLNGNKLTTTVKQGGKEQKEVSTIKKVTDEVLVVEDMSGKTQELRRKTK
ncbi:MAG TPA: DUF5640 domain-containing protein [Gemmataceae bacterium]|nr:DUF5640 domain-containing protein [Gemmataceae bacterium]